MAMPTRPTSRPARSSGATCWCRLKRTDEARAAYEKAKQSLPEDGAGDALQIKLDDLSKGEA